MTLARITLALALSFLLGGAAEGRPQRPAVTAGIENFNGRLRIFLANDSDAPFQGKAVIAVGNEAEQREIGQLSLSLDAQATSLLLLPAGSAVGNTYLLKLLDRRNALVFYKLAPLRSVKEDLPAREVRFDGSAPAPGAAPRPATETAAAAPAATAEFVIKPRLVAGENETEPYRLAFEITSLKPFADATISMTIGKYATRKTIALDRTVVAELKLPPPNEPLTADKLQYRLTDKAGRELAHGEIKLDQLMTEDYVTVSDIRTDRASYDFGDTARLTLLLEGQAPRGCRLELQARDARGSIFFNDQRNLKPEDKLAPQDVTIPLPGSGETPIIFEFKVYDGENGLLFDSGEREIPVRPRA